MAADHLIQSVNCTFNGYPEQNIGSDRDIIWYFTPSSTKVGSATIKEKKLLISDKYITILKQQSFATLTISNAQQFHNGTFRCFVQKYLGTKFVQAKSPRLKEDGVPTTSISWVYEEFWCNFKSLKNKAEMRGFIKPCRANVWPKDLDVVILIILF